MTGASEEETYKIVTNGAAVLGWTPQIGAGSAVFSPRLQTKLWLFAATSGRME